MNRNHFLLNPDITFLNHGSFGACPQPVFERYQAWQRELENQPVEFLGRRLYDLLAHARAQLASYVGTHPNHLVFVPNATHGTNMVARSLALQPGDGILTTDHEYGAAERTWRFVCQKSGAQLIHHPISLPVDEPDDIVERFWQHVTPRTRVIFMSHITSPTALTLPVKQICQRAKAAGILTLIDGAHAPGQIDLDLNDLKADFYAGNCHKWLCAPKGSGFLYARPECQLLLEPLVVSWGWESENPTLPFLDYFEWPGTHDPSAYLTVPTAIDYQQQHNWSQVRERCHQLASHLREQIQQLTGLAHICSPGKEWWQQMFTVPLPTDLSAIESKKWMWEKHRIEVPFITWQNKPYLRVSIQAYNDAQDGERLLTALEELLI